MTFFGRARWFFVETACYGLMCGEIVLERSNGFRVRNVAI